MTQPKALKSIFTKFRLLLFAMMGVLFLGYGVLIGKYEIFPYEYLERFKRVFDPVLEVALSDSQMGVITTNEVVLGFREFNTLNSAGLQGGGGGLAIVSDTVLGVDKNGQFFAYLSPGNILISPIKLINNENEFFRHVDSNVPNKRLATRTKRLFRFLDLEAKTHKDGFYLAVSFNHWNDDLKSKTTRLSIASFSSVASFLGLESSGTSEPEWKMVFESRPPLRFDSSPDSPFRSNRSGGRIIFESEESVLLALGDQEYDNKSNNLPLKLGADFSYSKLIRISLFDGSQSIIATGLRNPQGLLKDGAILWETEHGPMGGDELNLIELDSVNIDYGWPFHTYGTDYGSLVWPGSVNEVENIPFRLPIFSWVPSIATSNLLKISSIPEVWSGDLLVSSLKAKSLIRLKLTEGRVVFAEPIAIGSRIRDIIQTEDGTIILWTDEKKFIELVPKGRSPNSQMTYIDYFTIDELENNVDELFLGCIECHSTQPGASSLAPNLWGLYDRAIATDPFYRGYSAPLQNIKGNWNDGILTSFLTLPDQFAPGTSMPQTGLSNTEAASIAKYLSRLR